MPDIEHGAGTVTLEDVATSVHHLSQAVQDMRAGMIDRETVERIATDAVAGAAQLRSGYTPPASGDADIERKMHGASLHERFALVLASPAEETAPLLRCDVAEIEELRRRADDLVLLTAVMQAKGRPVNPVETRFFHEQFAPAFQAAFNTETAEQGAEFVPTELSSQLLDRINLQLRVLALFREVPMPTQPFELPARAVARSIGGRHAEQTTDTAQTKIKKIQVGSRKVTLSAAKFATMTLTSKEAEEDSIIAVLPFLRDELVDFTAADLENAAINGDTAETHRDHDSDAADDPRGNWDGIRKIAATNSSERNAGNKALSVRELRRNRQVMGKYGVDPSQLAHIIGTSSFYELLDDDKVQTIDKYGPRATLLTGELARVDGAPVIVSEHIREDLNASGVRAQTPGDRTVAITVNRRAFLRGTRRNLTVEILRELFSESDQDAVKVSTRQALAEAYEGEPLVAVAYNVAKAGDDS